MIKGVLAALLRLAADWLNPGITPADYRGVPTAECMCGGRMLVMHAWLRDDYELGGYLTEGECAECGAKLTVATPIDHPDFEDWMR